MVTNFLELDETLGRIFVHRKLAEAEKERRINKTIENADRLIYFQSETVRGRKKFFFTNSSRISKHLHLHSNGARMMLMQKHRKQNTLSQLEIWI